MRVHESVHTCISLFSYLGGSTRNDAPVATDKPSPPVLVSNTVLQGKEQELFRRKKKKANSRAGNIEDEPRKSTRKEGRSTQTIMGYVKRHRNP